MAQPFTIELDKKWWAEFRRQLKAATDSLDAKDTMLPDLMQKIGRIAEAEWWRRVPDQTGAADRSIKARRKQRSAEVWGGGKKAPYLGWLDFGGLVIWKQKANTGYTRLHLQSGDFRQRFRAKIYRTRIEGGRYMYKVVPAKEDEIMRTFEDGVQDILSKHFHAPI